MSEQNGNGVTAGDSNPVTNTDADATNRNSVTLPFKRYRCFKIVEALRICGIIHTAPAVITPVDPPKCEPYVARLYFGADLRESTDFLDYPDPALFARYSPVAGDYLVRYEDGYLSISPKKAFEDGYRLLAEDGA